jgi:alpha-galactosidase
MDSTTAAILTNRAAIAIDQDPLGRQGWRLRDRGAHEVWVKPLRGGDWAVCFFNRATEAAALRFDWNDLPGWGGPYQLYDCWAHEQQGTARRTGTWRGRVPGHGVRLFRLRRLSGDL